MAHPDSTIEELLEKSPLRRPAKSKDKVVCDLKFVIVNVEATIALLKDGEVQKAFEVSRDTWIDLGNINHDLLNVLAHQRKEREAEEHICPGPGVCEHGKSRSHRMEGD